MAPIAKILTLVALLCLESVSAQKSYAPEVAHEGQPTGQMQEIGGSKSWLSS